MELDPVAARLDQKERDKRRKNGECYGCGKSDHIIRNYLERKKNNQYMGKGKGKAVNDV